MSRILFRIIALSTIFVAIVAMNHLAVRSRAGAPLPTAQHGLTGNYYLGNRGWLTDAPPPANGFYQTWSDPNDFMLPRAITTPAATRVDAEVAFGQGKGFHVGPQGPQLVWWPTGFGIPQGWGSSHSPADKPWQANHFAAVIWRGYIHLPKAGTYYFGTVSNGASAVYLNQARVALNGWGGGELVSDAFSYANEQVQDFVTQGSSGKQPSLGDSRFQYAVPVPVDGPRDLPIEVDYDLAKSPSGWGNVALGIDFFWVTPDSPRDPNGKPVATIVPTDALYTEAPGPIEKPVVRSANSTISAGYFYVAAKSDNFVTVTVRLADKDGNPVAGKRVSLASVAAQRDEIVQPEKPTNEQGETTGKIRGYQGYSVPHDTTIFAADVTDFVDVAQVGHVMFTIPAGSFFPDSFSPYYDPHAPEVTPEPLQVGRQVTVKMPLVNRNTYPADLEVIFETHEFNIGASNWHEIGRVKNVRLQPGEHKDASIQWTPDQATGHICFRVSVNATKVASAASVPQALSASLLPAAFQQTGNGQQGGQPKGDSKTANKGAVSPPPPPECSQYWNAEGCFVSSPYPPLFPEKAQENVDILEKEREEIVKALNNNPDSKDRRTLTGRLECTDNTLICARYYASKAGQNYLKQLAQKDLADERIELDQAQTHFAACIYKYFPCTQESIAELVDLIRHLKDIIETEQQIVKDPPAASYRRLAVATSDTAPAYTDTVRVSWERYQSARSAADLEWMARHLTAINLYGKQVAESKRRQAAETEKRAEALPPDDPQELSALQANQTKIFEGLREGRAIPPDLRQQLLTKGIAETVLKDLERPHPEIKKPAELKGRQQTLLDFAGRLKTSADEWQQVADMAVNQETTGGEGRRLVQTYALANPHDRQETVDLFIRPISIPPDWKLSIVNAAEGQGGQAGKPGGTPPKYPVHELDPGKHYNITLPAKAETKVASVVIPVGEVGAHTTARWAVEGKIGNELIGGMVHEMNVPYIIPDLKLPPVGSKEVEEELPVPGRAWSRLVAELAAAVVVVGLFLFFFLFWRRRRRTTTET